MANIIDGRFQSELNRSRFVSEVAKFDYSSSFTSYVKTLNDEMVRREILIDTLRRWTEANCRESYATLWPEGSDALLERINELIERLVVKGY